MTFVGNRAACGTLFVAAGVLLGACEETDRDYYQGYVEGEYVYIASSVSGDLGALAVAKGGIVDAGDLLFQLDPNPQAFQIEETTQRMEQAQAKTTDISKGSRPSELEAIESRLKKARAWVELARRDYHRRLDAFNAGNTDVISEEELDRFRSDMEIRELDVETVEAELTTARLGGRSDAVTAARKEENALTASIAQLNWQLAEKTVSSPVGGSIQDTFFREGEFVPAARPVISLLPPGNIKIRFFVPQSLLPTIELRSRVQVKLDGLESRFGAQISFIAPAAEFTPPVIYSKDSRTKLVFMIEAVPDADSIAHLRPGQPLEVYLD